LREETLQAWLHLVIAIGQQQKKGLSSAGTGQSQEKFEADIVAPMQVFDDKQHGLLAGSFFEKAGQGRKKAAFLLLGLWQGCRKRVR
jgi:hypothetical protein